MQLICLDNDETLPMSSFGEDEETSNFKHLFSGDAIIVVIPCDLY